MPSVFVLTFVAGVTPAKWVDTWKTRMPQHPIEVRLAEQDAALHALRDGSATVALVRLPIAQDGLNCIPLYEEQPVVVVPRDHPISAFDSVARADLSGETILEGQSAQTVELVATGVGVALMPQSLARLHSRKDVVARRVHDDPSTRIALVWRQDDESAVVEEFIGIVRGRTANSSRGTSDLPVEQPVRGSTRAKAQSSRTTPSGSDRAAARKAQQARRHRRPR